MKKIYIVDVSGYLYSSYFAIRNMTNSKGESTNALYGFIRGMLKLIKDFQPTHLVAIFDGPHNGKKREAIYPDYKAHRSATPEDLPYQISWAHEFCALMGIPSLNIPEVEADDTMGAVAVWAEKQKADSYICTSDKDMCQLVNDHIFLLNTRKDNLIIDAKEVQKIHGVLPSQIVDLLSMTGDTSDNIPGLPGIGPKTAITFLQQFGTLENMLEHPEQITADKKRAIVKDNKDRALISKLLVSLNLDVEIPEDPSFYQLQPAQTKELKSFYSKMNFNSLIKELDNVTPQEIKEAKETAFEVLYSIVDDEESLQSLMEILKVRKEICFKVESGSSDRPLMGKLVGIAFKIDTTTIVYVPVNGKLGLDKVVNAIKPLFENPNIGFYGHDIKRQYHVLINYDIHIANICFDTLLASFILNSHHRQHSLEALFLQYFEKVKSDLQIHTGKGKDFIEPADLPPETIYRYCCEEVDYTNRLKSFLEQEICKREQQDLLYKIEIPLIKVLAKIENHGIFLDVPTLNALSVELRIKLDNLQKEIYAAVGEEFNINSPKQLSEILQNKMHIVLPKKTATGFSTNADILEDLKADYPIAQLLLDYRSLEKLRSTYVESLPMDVNPVTHRIHCTFNQSVAATGRLSCQDPNLQNIPTRTAEGRKIREAFRPEKDGWSYLAADYSQIELRLLAHFSEDPTLVAAFNNNEDIHTHTASVVLGLPIEEITKELRSKAKAVNFGIIYGQQAFGLAKELHIEVKEAANFIEMYFKRYPKIKEYIESCKELSRTTGKARTSTGRERLIPEINSKNGQLRALAERLAVNTPLQGTAADIIKLAMLKIDELLSNEKVEGFMILQIHDELVFELPDSEIDFFKPLVKEVMENVVQLKIPLIVDINVGKNWKEC